jgi:hypothetical protein
VDLLARSRRLLLTTALVLSSGACSPAGKLGPVGVSGEGTAERTHALEAGAPMPMLPGLPADFRSTWNKVGAHVTSEHGRFVADVYENAQTRFIEDLYAGDAGTGIYLIERSDAGAARFAVADTNGHTVADTDAGASVEPCVRCHAGARDLIFPIIP